MRAIDHTRGLTVERLKQVLHYTPASGLFVWIKKTRSNARFSVGDIAGSLNKEGYISIWIDGHKYGAHRLAWLYMTGEWPAALIDHDDTVRSNNRWGNLRPATNSQNKANGRKYADASPLPKGVTLAGNRYRSQIVYNYQHKHLGYFDTPEAAHAAYMAEAIRLHGDFARAA